MPDSEVKKVPSFQWLADAGEGAMVKRLVTTAGMMQELIYQTDEICLQSDEVEPTILFERLEKRKILLETIQMNQENIQVEIGQSKYTHDIKAELYPLIQQIVVSDKEMLERIQQRKQAVIMQLQELHNQKNIQQYMR
jgi:hypothetical protein